MDYPHWIEIRRPKRTGTVGDGTQSNSTGIWTEQDDTESPWQIIYEGFGDAQDKPQAIQRDAAGQPVAVADGIVFLEDESKIRLIQPDDLVIVYYRDATPYAEALGEVTKVNHFDGSLFVKGL